MKNSVTLVAIIVSLFFIPISTLGQSQADNCFKIEALLNKAKGKLFTNEYNSEHKIGKQTFTPVSASFTEDGITKNHRTYITTYSELDWKEMTWYFGSVIKNKELQELTIKLKRAAKIVRSTKGENNATETFTVELTFYFQQKDIEQLKLLLNAIK